eukprot:GFKZ01009862.1.p1 GENE.GFKZ01009862.1~~GFKZ01009862.1.p1  ORF type:complete len:138 (-),score=2.91 GFKZ01009862.1:27-440(-)
MFLLVDNLSPRSPGSERKQAARCVGLIFGWFMGGGSPLPITVPARTGATEEETATLPKYRVHISCPHQHIWSAQQSGYNHSTVRSPLRALICRDVEQSEGIMQLSHRRSTISAAQQAAVRGCTYLLYCSLHHKVDKK